MTSGVVLHTFHYALTTNYLSYEGLIWLPGSLIIASFSERLSAAANGTTWLILKQAVKELSLNYIHFLLQWWFPTLWMTVVSCREFKLRCLCSGCPNQPPDFFILFFGSLSLQKRNRWVSKELKWLVCYSSLLIASSTRTFKRNWKCNSSVEIWPVSGIHSLIHNNKAMSDDPLQLHRTEWNRCAPKCHRCHQIILASKHCSTSG